IHDLIHFLHAKIMSSAEIHGELYAVYSRNIMSGAKIRQRSRMFTMEREVVGRPSVAIDGLLYSTDQEICERRHFTISEFSSEFPQISSNFLCEIITVRLGYHKFCATWVPKILTGAYKMDHFDWELFDHPSYGPDLAPSEYHLFTYLKNWLRSQSFNNNEELMEGVKMWLSSQAADFFDIGLQNLLPNTTSASVLEGD
ncbi:hypothetical protein B7P43_G09442, partial [Cryptotermes secundus]